MTRVPQVAGRFLGLFLLMAVAVPVPFPAGFVHLLPLMLEAMPGAAVVLPLLTPVVRAGAPLPLRALAVIVGPPIIGVAEVVIVQIALRIRLSSTPLRAVPAVSVPISRTLRGEG